jgi:hypothetical protein
MPKRKRGWRLLPACEMLTGVECAALVRGWLERDRPADVDAVMRLLPWSDSTKPESTRLSLERWYARKLDRIVGLAKIVDRYRLPNAGHGPT